MIKLIVSDFDGTLCENGRISDLTLGKISDLVASEKLFTVSSGRDITELYDFFRDLKSKISFIAFDGALAVCNNHTVFHVPFSIETLSRVTADTEDNVVRFIGAENSWCFNDKNNRFLEDIHITKSFQIKEHIYKIIFYGQRSEKELIGARLHYSDENTREYVPAFANKGVALGAIQRYFGISVYDTLAMGDNDNDISMMQNAKYSVSVGSRDSRIHKVCAYRYPTGVDVLNKVLKNDKI